ncbi:unnamed protein product [Protopolystoma xenopodis]|uniref:Uncharacterized protein n=1 Tax=Protopolystoma xenopodis TaxID=117903 RepID=A0A3S5AWE6_9PLAT|nr:unnamed protein product [Protopolystoma xenopodis]
MDRSRRYLRFYLFKLFAGAFPSSSNELVSGAHIGRNVASGAISASGDASATGTVGSCMGNETPTSCGGGSCSSSSSLGSTSLWLPTIRVMPPRVPLASHRQLTSIARLILIAQRPVLVLGSQLILPPVPIEETAANVKVELS